MRGLQKTAFVGGTESRAAARRQALARCVFVEHIHAKMHIAGSRKGMTDVRSKAGCSLIPGMSAEASFSLNAQGRLVTRLGIEHRKLLACVCGMEVLRFVFIRASFAVDII